MSPFGGLPCQCGEPGTPGVTHCTNKPCHVRATTAGGLSFDEQVLRAAAGRMRFLFDKDDEIARLREQLAAMEKGHKEASEIVKREREADHARIVELEAALAAQPPAQPAEPVGVIGTQKGGAHWTVWDGKNAHTRVAQDAPTAVMFKTLPLGTFLYTTPQPPAQPAPTVELGDRFMEILRAIHGDMPDNFADSARLAFVHAVKEAAHP